MNLDDLLNEMSEKIRNRDLSDEYLREHNNSTREEIGIGEYAYGITMIPCEWVYEYLSDYKRVLEINEVLLKENEILKEEKEQAWEEWNNLERGSYETEQKLKQQIKELQKKNDELKKLMAHKNWYTSKLEEDLFENASNYVIKKEKVKDKIKEIDEKIKYEENEKVVIYLHKQKNILQELLKESEEEHDGK